MPCHPALLYSVQITCYHPPSSYSIQITIKKHLLSGFKVVTDVITSKKKRALMWVVGLITFFMSAVLDNLTTTIVMVSLVKKVILRVVTLMLITYLIELLADFD
jgi:Na+/H+ antiporter NhaD/arsenite permease-like protein